MMISPLNSNSYVQYTSPVLTAVSSQTKADVEQAVQPQQTDTLVTSSNSVDEPVSINGAMLRSLSHPTESGGSNVQESASVAQIVDEQKVLSDEEVAAACNGIAVSGASREERTESIMELLGPAVERAESPDPTWVKATPEQLKLFVGETLEHIDGLRAIGQLRGMDFSHHDMEDGCGKFQPQVAQFLALPGRNDAVKWAIAKHNAAEHHDVWKDPNATKEQLAESASDIINAWRMERPVYSKPSWSWEKITDVINSQFADNMIGIEQRDALYEAIPFQMEYESSLA